MSGHLISPEALGRAPPAAETRRPSSLCPGFDACGSHCGGGAPRASRPPPPRAVGRGGRAREAPRAATGSNIPGGAQQQHARRWHGARSSAHTHTHTLTHSRPQRAAACPKYCRMPSRSSPLLVSRTRDSARTQQCFSSSDAATRYISTRRSPRQSQTRPAGTTHSVGSAPVRRRTEPMIAEARACTEAVAARRRKAAGQWRLHLRQGARKRRVQSGARCGRGRRTRGPGASG